MKLYQTGLLALSMMSWGAAANADRVYLDNNPLSPRNQAIAEFATRVAGTAMSYPVEVHGSRGDNPIVDVIVMDTRCKVTLARYKSDPENNLFAEKVECEKSDHKALRQYGLLGPVQPLTKINNKGQE